MDSLFLVILIGLVGIGVGFALGSLIMGQRPPGLSEPSRPVAPLANLVRIATLWSDRGRKNLYLDMDGRLIRSASDLSAEMRLRLLPLLEILNSWLGALPKPAVGAAAPDQSRADHEMALVDLENHPASEVKRPSMSPVNVLARAIQSDVVVPEPPAKSIVMQVDEILQEKLKDTPMEKRGVRLMELPNKGMVVMVGLDRYESVDEVPDEEVRGLIRSAVAEWEARIAP